MELLTFVFAIFAIAGWGLAIFLRTERGKKWASEL